MLVYCVRVDNNRDCMFCVLLYVVSVALLSQYKIVLATGCLLAVGQIEPSNKKTPLLGLPHYL